MDAGKAKKIIKAVAAGLSALIAAVMAALGLNSCGVTRASIVQPKDNSATTITITTNNPISTTVSPETSVPLNLK